jgi:hypothetical protein
MSQPRILVWRFELLEQAKARLSGGDEVLQPALDRLIAEANEALQVGPFSVVDKTRLPSSGDAHDYFSYGPYWWPDPGKPDGLPYIRRDGEVNPESRDANSDRPALQAMIDAVVTLTLAFHFTGRPVFAEHAALLLRTWFLAPATRMRPHLEYAQAIPGRVDGRGIGIIDTTRWVTLIDALGLLELSPSWKEADRAGMRAWFAEFLDWLLNSAHGQDEARQRNNHGTWYDAQVAAYALYLGRRDLAHSIIAESRSGRIDTQLESDGSQPYELARTRSFSYSLYNLLALMALARLGEWVDIDLWRYIAPNGAGIRQAIDYVTPYADPSVAWPHPQITPLEPDRLLAILSEAAYVYRDARYLDQIGKMDAVKVRSQRANLLWASRRGMVS